MERFPCNIDSRTERELLDRTLAGDRAAWQRLWAELWHCVVLRILWEKASSYALEQLERSGPGTNGAKPPAAEPWFRHWFERAIRDSLPPAAASQAGNGVSGTGQDFEYLRKLHIRCSQASAWDQQMFRRSIAKWTLPGLLNFELSLSRHRAKESDSAAGPALDPVVMLLLSQELNIERDQLADNEILWILLKNSVRLFLRLAFSPEDLDVLARWARDPEMYNVRSIGPRPEDHDRIERILRKVKQRLRDVLAVKNREQGKVLLRAYLAGETLHPLWVIDRAISRLFAKSNKDEKDNEQTDGVDTRGN